MTKIPEEKVQVLRKHFVRVFSKLSRGEYAYVKPLLDMVYGELDRGEIDDAIATLQTYPMPTETLRAARDLAIQDFLDEKSKPAATPK